jgi:cell division protein FtsL
MTQRPTSRSTPPEAADRGGLRLALALAAGAAVVTSSLVFLVHTKSQQIETGYRIHDLRQELVRLEHQRTSLEVERAALARPSRVALLARTALQLVPPRIDTALGGAVAPSSEAP